MSENSNKYFKNLLKENNDIAIKLVERLNKLAKENNSRLQISSHTLFFSPEMKHTKETERFNSAFYNLGIKEALSVIRDLIKIWELCDINSDPRIKPTDEALKVFGKSFKHMIGRRLLFTVTSDKKEFRCWYGTPGYITKDHVDSNAQGLLFHIRATPELIEQYPKGLFDEDIVEKCFLLSNGTTFYGLRWE